MHDALLGLERFKDISLGDPFFDSLKSDYSEFGEWFLKKGEHQAYTFRNQAGLLDGFLYLKLEDGPILDANPALPSSRRLKIGTFKINPHGTRLGERFIKRAFDVAVHEQVEALYVTIFAKHTALVDLFLRYGFVQRAIKKTANGQELVLERRLDSVSKDVVRDYPRIPIATGRHFVLSLYPQWHSRLLPDSLLATESSSILQDISHANSIHKIYLAAMSGVEHLRRDDTLLIYRTAQGGSAYYTSVVTSLCVVEELTNIRKFATVEQFLAYCAPYSIFSEGELRGFYHSKKYPWVIRFTYNLALRKRPNRKALIEQVGISPDIYWGFFQISTPQLKNILQLSGDYEKASSLVYSS
ncbi:N-acetyltransferase [Ralstonia pseudosolanacearum]|uniref:N-acetyltransferase n=1 Tax=Ralstonia solanacearum TaxID=305 RepID=A0A0S4X3I0_RALSL|nr:MULTISPECIES: N-acetyltransferase [Ralstonia]QWQ12024.1 N-acetyltransferase [Ralstonia solanacearum]MDO3578600.1 N-acetyltransferase [Ralstonia pseudosolanacearum]MDO3588041.1 N-acetyltransferase [Ralstonia pseudosolanacearum]UZF14902.1 N-acetyltransferase [Ralstonia solanacearum]UZF25001.1 N-acetyltransferase [Ralstonia sp. RS642]